MLTQSRLKELLHYDPDSGVFTWMAKPGKRGRPNIGDIAGSIMNRGYRHIKIDGKLHLGHRLAFLYMTGEFPAADTDHINGIRDDNRWLNLRQCTNAENQQNKAPHKNSSSKYVGVSWHKRCQKWRARIRINGKLKYLGLFQAESEAYAAYCKAKSELHQFNPQPRETAHAQ
jgi:hypothetical protein